MVIAKYEGLIPSIDDNMQHELTEFQHQIMVCKSTEGIKSLCLTIINALPFSYVDIILMADVGSNSASHHGRYWS